MEYWLQGLFFLANRLGCCFLSLLEMLPLSPQDYFISSNQMEHIKAIPVIPHLLILRGSQKNNCLEM